MLFIVAFFISSHSRKVPSSVHSTSSPVAEPAPPGPGSGTPTTPYASPGAVAAPARPAANPAPEADKSRAAFGDFSRWAEQHLAGGPSAGAAEGVALAWKRREAMLALIETDPEQAIALAAPYRWRTALPSAVTRLFEEWVDGRGAFNVAVATDINRTRNAVYRSVQIGTNEYRAYVYGRRVGQVSQSSVPLHGLVLGGNHGKMAVLADPLRWLEPGEAQALEELRGTAASTTCPVCGQTAGGQPVAADAGGDVVYFCGPDHAQLAAEQLARLGGGAAGASLATAANDEWTHGPKTVLYIRLNFPDDLTQPVSEAEAYDVMDSVNSFYTQNSYDQTSLMPTVTPLVTVPRPKAWYGTAGPFALMTDAREAARLGGFDTSNYDLDILCFTPVPGYDWAGLGYVHGKGTWLQSPGVIVTAHELGHNYGLWHANNWDTTNSGSSIGPGTNYEYGNIYDVMGSGGGHFNALFKNILDWLPEPAIASVTGSGVWRLYPFDVPDRINGRRYAARIRKDFERDYWIEYRQAASGNLSLQYGVLVNWSAWSETSGSSLLDTTPGTPAPGRSLNDAAVMVGRTFSDLPAGVHVTPIGYGRDTADQWLDVQFNLGAFPNNRSPELSLELSRTKAAPGEAVRFFAVADDPDGDTLAYSWFFDNAGSYDGNLSWTFRSWGAAGDHVVRCVVSDMKGGIASANAIVTVGDRAGYRISGRILDLQGEPVEGVRVDNGTNDAAAYLGGYTDSEGAYVITGVTEDLALTAVKYGFSFTNVMGPDPLVITNDLAGVNYIATPLPVVAIRASVATAPENGGSAQFTISRLGDTSTNLLVALDFSGSAVNQIDFNLNPALVASNMVDIPPGASSVTVDFQARNDSLVEGLETVELILADDPTYVIGAVGAAAIGILDDDSPATPVVSIASLTPMIPENGKDSGAFEFMRSSTQGDLPVNYAVSGTAAPGADYATLVGVAIIPSGRTNVVVQFQTRDDKDVEPDETVVVTISPSGAYTGGGSAQVELVDDDLLTVTVFPTASGAAEPSTSGVFTVKRDGDLSGNLVVGYTVSGSATSGSDFVPLSGTVTLPAGAPSANVTLTPLNDSLVEGDESVVITLITNVTCNVGTPGRVTLLIHDDEKPSVTISAPDSSVSENGDDLGRIVVSRGSVVSGNLPVYLAVSGTAIPGADYLPLDNPIIIPDGAGSVPLDVIAFHDLILESSETVIVTVLPDAGYNSEFAGQAVLEITDDGLSQMPGVGFCFAASSAAEGISPGVCVSLSVTSSSPVTVDYRVIGGTASSNTDYVLPPGTFTINPGEQATSLMLPVTDDASLEPDETIRLVVFNPTNATLDGIKIHTYTIRDDDTAAVSVAATAPAALETGPVAGNFRISRTGATAAALTVYFQITGTASAPADFAPLGGSATIPAGAAFVDLPVVPVNDQTVEFSETAVLTLLRANGAYIASPSVATVTISDNDVHAVPVVTLSVNRRYAVEGGASGEFLLTRTGPTIAALTVEYTVSGTAGAGSDYTALSGVALIPAGQASVIVPVAPVNDTSIEGDETVVLHLTIRNTYRAAYPATATVIVQDDDQMVWVYAADFAAAEPGSDLGRFVFARFGSTNFDVQVFFNLGGTAVNGVDYGALSGSVTIPAGYSAANLWVTPLDDALVEGPETLILTLTNSPAYQLTQPTSAMVTVMDDEPMITIVAAVSNVVEGSQSPGVFRLVRFGNPEYDFTARLVAGGTATPGADYPPFLTNVFFSCGVTAVDLVVFPTNELAVESEETVTATLLPDPAYTIIPPDNAALAIQDPGTNQTPVVLITSPTARTVFLPGTNANMILEATVTDDGDTNVTPLIVSWTKISGPDTLVFGDTNAASTTVSLTNTGIYVLRLTADDGTLQAHAEVTAIVGAVEMFAVNALNWPLDEGEGTNVLDVSGAGRHGFIEGAAVWSTNGVLGGALRLNGTNNCLRQTGGADWLNGLKAFTLSLRVNSTATSAGHGLFCAEDSGAMNTLSLFTSAEATCGRNQNVIEATIATSKGAAHFVSDGGVATNGWQHLLLAWSNGLAPMLFINGQKDQPWSQRMPLKGMLTNCTQFVVGKSPRTSPASWDGWVDDVRFFNRLVSLEEMAALAALPPTNYAAWVDAGSNVTVQLFVPLPLKGVVTDDGRPVPPGLVVSNWTMVKAPDVVGLTNAIELTNEVVFTETGDYVLRLTADDGQVKTFDDLEVTVIQPTRCDIWASDGDAAEMGPEIGMGPDPGQFTLTRDGDALTPLTVYLDLGGFASNGVDFILVPDLGAVTFPAGSNSLTFDIVPFLDHRIEGDEPFMLTLISNLAYSIGSGEATVTIHDSPYGDWSVERFTLEELTDPRLSSEAVDYDHDGLLNFVEYALDRDPKAVETNAPVAVTIETNAVDSLPHITLTFTRRIEPTDAGYAASVSSDLHTWHTGAGHLEEIEVTPDENNVTETVRAQVVAPYANTGNTFVTVRVWLRATGP